MTILRARNQAPLLAVFAAATLWACSDPLPDDGSPGASIAGGMASADGKLIESNLLWFDAKSGPSMVAEAMLRGLPGRCTLGDLTPSSPQMWKARVPSVPGLDVEKKWMGISINDFRTRISPDGTTEAMETIDFWVKDFEGCEEDQGIRTCTYDYSAAAVKSKATISINTRTSTMTYLDVFSRYRLTGIEDYHITCQ